MIASLVFKVFGLTAEVSFLDLWACEVRFEQIILGEQVCILKSKAFFHAARIGIGFNAHGDCAGGAQRVPDGKTVLIAHMQFPALFANIGNAERGYVFACNADRLDGRKWEVFEIKTFRIFDNLLEIVAGIRSPDSDGDVFFRYISDGNIKAFIFGYATHVMEVARTSIGAVDHADTVSHADRSEVGTHHTFLVEEVGVNAFSDIGIAADLCGT